MAAVGNDDRGVGSGADAGRSVADAAAPFWETKSLEAMSPEEWEQLCDGCGRCCLLKVEDEDCGDVALTRLACRLLDLETCRCRNYRERHSVVQDCAVINPAVVRAIPWLPESCAYRRIAEGRGLAWWHPLVSGDPKTVHAAGISVRAWAQSEDGVPAAQLERYIIDGEL